MSEDAMDILHEYLNGTELTDEQSRDLSAWVCASAENADLVAKLTHQDSIAATIAQDSSYASLLVPGDDDIEMTSEQILAEVIELDRAYRRSIEARFADRRTDALVPRLATPLSEPSLGQPTSFLRVLRWAGLAAAVLVLFMGLAILLLPGTSPPASINVQGPQPEQATARIAVLVDQHQAKWGVGSQLPVTRGLSADESFDLRSGLAELRFSSGNTVVIEGPATGRIVDAWTMVLDSGRVVARSEDGARGFAVQTKGADFVDLGTEFGVSVSFGKVESVVFDGLIAVRPRDGSKLSGNISERVAEARQDVLIAEGQYVQVSGAGKLEVHPVTRTQDSLLYRRSAQSGQDPYTAYARTVLGDEPLLYWDMQDISGGIVRNAVDRPAYDAPLRDTPLMPGGLGGGFLAFGTDPQQLSTLYPDQPLRELDGSDTYTIECWFRAARFHRGELANLFVKNPDSGLVRDQVLLELIDEVEPSVDSGGKPRGVRFVHRDTPSPSGGSQLFSTPYALGQWVHVVCVKDGQQLTLYLNGQRVSGGRSGNIVATDLYLSVGVIHFGSGTNLPRQLVADLDEFAVYRHALTPQQIQRHHELGQQALKQSY